jgi:hypothetical protein
LSALKVSNGSTWSFVGLAGITALGATGLANGATLTSNNYLQLAYSIGGSTTSSYLGLMPDSYSDIFSDLTIDLGAAGPTGNFGMNWMQSTSGTVRNWTSVSSSASGEYQTAVVNSGYIYTSSNYGNTWVEMTSVGTSNWYGVSVSASGQYQTAVSSSSSNVYISSNYGVTWTTSEYNNLSQSLNSVRISSSGKYQTVIGNYVYVSSNYGSSWRLTSLVDGRAISLSASGQYQTYGVYGGYIYISSDYGNTWKSTAFSAYWGIHAICVSASGQYQNAAVDNGYIYISSDYGNTWKQSSNSVILSYYATSMSASGQYQVAAGNSTTIYISSNYGNTWTQISSLPSQNWYSVSISASGQYITGVGNGGYIYVCKNSLVSNAVIQVGGYTSGSGVTGVVGSLYYDTTLSALKVSNGSTWTSVGVSGMGDILGVTGVGLTATNGATVTTGGYLQLVSAGLTSPGLVTTTGQTFAGDKYFRGSLGVSGLLGVGNYPTASGPTFGTTGSLFYDTTLSALKVSNGSTWTSVGVSGMGDILGVTGVGLTATNGATVTTGGYLQLVSAGLTSPGLVTTTGQTFAGDKYFRGSLGVSGVIGVGNYPTASGPTFGTTGSLFYDTTLSALKVSNGSTWSFVGLAGITALGATGLSNGAILTSNGYLQLAYASAAAAMGPTFGITANAGLMPGSYSDIFTSSTIDLGFAGPTGNFGTNWSDVNSSIGAQSWISIAVSGSGQYQAAVVNDGYYLSSDYGNNWTSVTPITSSTALSGVGMSTSGQYQTVCSDSSFGNACLAVSSNYGATWSTKFSGLGSAFIKVAISASGQYQYVSTASTSLYVSSDYGNTWNIYNVLTKGYGLSTSASGQYVILAAFTGIQVSSNYGVDFKTVVSFSSSYSTAVMNSSGKYQAYVLGGYQFQVSDYIYISSDYGQTWTPTASQRFWGSVVVSSSGQYLVASLNANSQLYFSSDYGKTWTPNGAPRNRWQAIAISSCGQYISAAVNSGYIYVCKNSLVSNAVIQVGGYTSGSGVTGVTGSLYYDRTFSALRITNGSTWSYVGFVGTTALGATGSLYYDITKTAGATALLVSSGSGWTSVKSFVIDHPTNSEKLLIHGCLEGPEAGVYYRGESEITNNTEVSIQLPEYVDKLATNLTVQVTPIYNGTVKTLNVSKVRDSKFTVYGDNCEFFWTVFGKRISFEVEPNKTGVIVKGDGPYKWI